MDLKAVGISGSPLATSRSRALLAHALAGLGAHGYDTTLIDLSALPAEALLARAQSAEVAAALAAVADASVIVASTPVYRATYTGLLKVFFDLFPQRALVGKVGISIATGGASGHQLVLEHGLRPLFASVGAVVVPTGIYATDADLADAVEQQRVYDRIDRAVAQATALTDVNRAAVPALAFTREG